MTRTAGNILFDHLNPPLAKLEIIKAIFQRDDDGDIVINPMARVGILAILKELDSAYGRTEDELGKIPVEG